MLVPKSWQRANGAGHPITRELLQGVRRAGVPTYRQKIPDISAELRRCRRYERPLVVLTVGLDRGDAPRNPELECMLFLLLGALLCDVTRESDIVTYAAEEHVYALFLPESDAAAAMRAARRLAAAFHARTATLLRAGLAEYPAQGLTVDALLANALTAHASAPTVPTDLDDAEEPRQENETWLNVRKAQ